MKTALPLHQSLYILTAAKPAREMQTRSHPYLAAGTVQWVSQLAFEPLLIGVSVGIYSHLNETIDHNGSFTLHLLEDKPSHREAVHLFSRDSKIEENTINGWPYTLKDRALIFEDLAYYHCQLLESYRLGDHTLHVGAVSEFQEPKENWQPLHTANLDFNYSPDSQK